MKYYGNVGYANSVEASPGVWKEQIITRPYYGDILRNARRLQTGEYLNDDISVGNSISIIADAYAYENFFSIRFVEWMGVKWKVDTVEVQRPRLILSLGGVYNA